MQPGGAFCTPICTFFFTVYDMFIHHNREENCSEQEMRSLYIFAFKKNCLYNFHNIITTVISKDM